MLDEAQGVSVAIGGRSVLEGKDRSSFARDHDGTLVGLSE
ncbi:hypothetical protein CHCC20375_0719 [Bacillus licheniformis]|nr:hypothetical protein CHCC20375_0719 [Bacillus licheniformis]